jgi:hypothetical protein
VSGDEPGEVEIYIERAECAGRPVYRWVEDDGSGAACSGKPRRSRDRAVQAAITHAIDQDDSIDIDSIISDILGSGFFARGTNAQDILEVCEAASEHSQGYLLLAADEPPPQPAGIAWTTNGYLEVPYIRLAADHASAAYAADSLLREVQRFER